MTMFEPTSLSLSLYRIGETLSAEYGIDPEPLYRELNLDPDGPADAGERQPSRMVTAMLERALELTGDPAVGIRVGLNSEPRHFFVIGHVWLAGSTLADGIRRLVRYEDIFNSGDTDIDFVRSGDSYVLSESYPNPADYPGKLRVDVSIASIVKMCGLCRGAPLSLERLEIVVPEANALDIYLPLVSGPVLRSETQNALYFSAGDLDERLKGAIPDVVDCTCQIADRYLDSLDSACVSHQVRAQLVQALPGGSVDQEEIASRLYRSASTLQRQLSNEGTTYRDVLANTRRELAEAYLREGSHSQAQIAFLLGFSDQASFSRAFKRWTGSSPGSYRQSA